MTDVVVTVPLTFGLQTWIDEGDPAGAPWSGEEWHFYLNGKRPNIEAGERVYVVYNGALRGYAPLIRIDGNGWRYGLVRHGDAVAVSIPRRTSGFQGFQYRWWKREEEQPFPNWQDPDAALFERLPRDTSGFTIACRRPAGRPTKPVVETPQNVKTFWTDMKGK